MKLGIPGGIVNDTQAPPYFEHQTPPPPPPLLPYPEKPKRPSRWRGALVVVGVVMAFLIGLVAGDDTSTLKRAADSNEALQTEIADLDERLLIAGDNNEDLRARTVELSERVDEVINERNAAEIRLAIVRSKLDDQRTQEAAAPPGSGEIDVSYGDSEWKDLFTMSNLSLGQDFDNTPKLEGTITYNGGGDCNLGYVEVEALFYSGGELLTSGFTNFTSLPVGTPRALEILTYDDSGAATSADLTLVEASCN